MSKYARDVGVVGCCVAAFCCVLAPQAYGLEESTGPGGSNAIAVHQLGETGEGVNVGLDIGQERANHTRGILGRQRSHAFNYDFTGDGISILNSRYTISGNNFEQRRCRISK